MPPSCEEKPLALVKFASSTKDGKFRDRLLMTILEGQCPDFICSLDAPWGTAHVVASAPQPQGVEIKLPDISDIAPGGVVGPCIADIEKMLADQCLEPTALNWIAVCDHFLSQSLISPECATAFRLLRRSIESTVLSAVTIRVPANHEEKSE